MSTRSSFQGRNVVLLVFLVGVSCTGSVDGTGADKGPGNSRGGTDGSGAGGGSKSDETSSPMGAKYAPARVRRLTTTEIRNSLRDAVLGGAPFVVDFPGDSPLRHGYDNDFDSLAVSTDFVASMQEVAERAAVFAVKNLPALLGCDVQKSGEPACLVSFFTQVGRRLYRQPLSAAQKASLTTVFNEARASADFPTAIGTVIEQMIQSPYFLFRAEFGDRTGRLTPVETASALSYFLWSSGPDDVLLDAAVKGQLATAADRTVQATRMLQDARAKDAFESFIAQWFELTDPGLLGRAKSDVAYPSFNETGARDMRTELRMFLDNVVWKGEGKLSDLFSSNATYVNGTLASIYGLGASAPNTAEFEPVMADSATRSGLFTRPAFLASLGAREGFSPIKFGRLVRARMFCDVLPPPPPNVPPLAAPTASVSTRERYAQHSADPACSGCHKLFEPIGWAFERYDAIGHYQTSEKGIALTGAGELTGTDVDGKFNGAVELASRMLDSRKVTECTAANVLRYALGRDVTDRDRRYGVDQSTLSGIAQDIGAASNLALPALLKTIAASDAFVWRDNAALPIGGDQ